MKKKKRNSRQAKLKKLRKKCDELWQQIIRSRGKCEKCGNIKALNAAHIISRNNRHTRWEILNGLALCVKCHFWAHQNSLEFVEWVKGYLGRANYQKLRKMALSLEKLDLEEIYDKLEKRK